MNKRTEITLSLIGVLLAILALLFGDNLYEQITGHSIFDRTPVSPSQTSPAMTTPTPTSTDTPSPTSVDLVQGLIAYFPFDGDATDQSGNGHHGMVLGASMTNDRWGNPNSAYQFDGIDDYVTVLDALDFRAGLKPISITFWFRAHDLKWDPIVSKFLDARSKDWGTHITNGYLEFASENGTSEFADYVCSQDSKTIQAVQWYFAAFVANEPTVSLYLNGELVGICSDFVNKWTPTTADIEIGRDGYAKHYFRGMIDEVRIYNRALTQEEIIYLQNIP